jgi:uncharacterized protein involved in exopolysaccharide biosynthesis
MNDIQNPSFLDTARTDELPSRREILRVLFRHKRKIVWFFLSTVMITGVATLLVTPTYESESKLLIRVGRESVSMDPSVVGPTLPLSPDKANEINSEISILTSRYLAERVIKEIGVAEYLGLKEPGDETLISSFEGAVTSFLSHLSATSSGDSNIITLTFRARDPELARLSLATLIKLFLDRHIEIHSTQASPAFYQQRSAELLQKLTLAEDQLDHFRDENKIASIDVQKEVLISQISGLETALNDVNGNVDASEARIAALQNSLSSRARTSELTRVTGITNVAADQIKSRLIDLRFQETDLASRYPDDERALIEIRRQVNVALAELEKEQETRTEITTGIDRNFEALQLDLMTARSQLYAGMARLRSLSEELEVKRIALTDLAGEEIGLDRLERAVDIVDREYREYVAHHQRADISAALDSSKVSNVSIVQPATSSMNSVAPRRFLNMLLSLLIGLFGGVGIAYLAELLDDSLKTKEDVANRLGLPVLISLSAEEFQSCT